MPYTPGRGKPYTEQPITKDELAVIYASLILADDDVPITAEKIETILAAAEVEVEPIWPQLFARALTGISIKDLISNIGQAAVGGGGGGMGGTAAGGSAGTEAAGGEKEEEKKEEEKKVEEEDSSDEDFGLSLFD